MDKRLPEGLPPYAFSSLCAIDDFNVHTTRTNPTGKKTRGYPYIKSGRYGVVDSYIPNKA